MKNFIRFGEVKAAAVTDISGPPVLDPQGSTQDFLLAEAIMANEPTSVLVQEGIVTVQKLPPTTDEARFPILRNKNFYVHIRCLILI